MWQVALNLLWMSLLAAACGLTPSASDEPVRAVSGERALEHVRAQVALGPRPPGSEAIAKTRSYLMQHLSSYGYQIEEDSFEPQTPYGPKRMVNLIARKRPGEQGVIVLASHYDTKYMERVSFVGANDGGSSTGLLLELARVLSGHEGGLDYWFVFFDGEEAFVEWSSFDSTYGSRHLARRWKEEGIIPKIKALILLDMIGDKDLDLLRESNSTPWLRQLVISTATETGLGGIFSNVAFAVEDDHIPFLDAGVPSVDLIDLNYGPGNSYHHSPEDTLDKVSAESLEKVGKLTLSVLQKLQQRFRP